MKLKVVNHQDGSVSIARTDGKAIKVKLSPGESVVDALARALRGEPRSGAQTERDIRVENHGSIMLFRPLNDGARKHLEENVQDDAQWFGGALVVEPRYAEGLAANLEAEGYRL